MKLIKLTLLILCLFATLMLTVSAEGDDPVTGDTADDTANVGTPERVSRLDGIPTTTTVPPSRGSSEPSRHVLIPIYSKEELLDAISTVKANEKNDLIIDAAALHDYNTEEYETVYWFEGYMSPEYMADGSYVGRHFTEHDYQSLSIFSEVYYRDTYGQYLIHRGADSESLIQSYANLRAEDLKYNARHRYYSVSHHFYNYVGTFDKSKIEISASSSDDWMPPIEGWHYAIYEGGDLLIFPNYAEDVNDEIYAILIDSMIFLPSEFIEND